MRHRLDHNLHPGNAQPFMGKERTADNRPAEDVLLRNALHPELYEAVIEENPVSRGHAFRQPPVGDRYLVGGIRKVFDRQNNLIALFQQKRLLQELADSYLGTGKVHHDQAMVPKPGRNGSDAPDILSVPLPGAVSEIEPRHIHAPQHQLFQNGLRTGGRSYGADDLGFVGR